MNDIICLDSETRLAGLAQASPPLAEGHDTTVGGFSRAIGAKDLCVSDASMVPTMMPGYAINSATMIGGKAAERIKEGANA